MAPSIERKLAAIVFTDIVGYTELSATDEESAFRLIEIQREIIKPIVEEFNGNWLKEIGDGLLLSFPSSIQAVQCSIKIQVAINPLKNLNLRIGIHQGDILQKGDDIFGDDVNIASRIQEHAPVGEIAISQKVQADISSHPEYITEYIGDPELKGVKQEIKIYSVLSATGGVVSPAKPVNQVQHQGISKSSFLGAVASIIITIVFIYMGIDYFSSSQQASSKTSIAVLNFDNIRKFSEYDWLEERIASNLTFKLGEISEIRMIDRLQILNKLGEIDPDKASIIDYKINQVAKNIDVNLILHGNFTIMGDIIEITAFFADTQTGDQIALMLEQYPLNELSDIPSHINKKISTFIKTNDRFKPETE